MSRRLRDIPPRSLDWLIVLALTAYAEIDVWLRPGVVPGPHALAAAVLPLVTVPLAWRRRLPLGVACVSMGALAAESLAAGGAPEGGAILLPVLVVLFSLGAYASLARALAGAGVSLVAVVVQSVQDPKLAGAGSIVLVDVFFFGLIGGAVWVAGRYVRRRRGVETDLTRRAESLEHERRRQAEIVAAERGRIARELHDVIAHTVSVMGVQAAAAEEVLDVDPEQARAPLEAIQATARDSIEELRRLLAVLREEDETVELAPQPDLARLDELIAQMRDAGVHVEVEVTGARTPLPAGIELAAYRILQEALTNVRKHASPPRAQLKVTYAPNALELLVEDQGRLGRRAPGTGHGLVGMRERAALYGGTLETERPAGGGFRVRACLPVPQGFA